MSALLLREAFAAFNVLYDIQRPAEGDVSSLGSTRSELRATDPQLLRGLSEGEWVKVDFTTDGDRVMINSVERAEPDAASGPTPTAVGGPTEFGTNIRAH